MMNAKPLTILELLMKIKATYTIYKRQAKLNRVWKLPQLNKNKSLIAPFFAETIAKLG